MIHFICLVGSSSLSNKVGPYTVQTLYDFKEVFDKTLETEESFTNAAFYCTQSFKLKFDKICKGTLSEFV